MSRSKFFIISCIFQLIFYFLQNDIYGVLFFIPFYLIVAHYRLNNIGMSGWWVFTLFAPILNFYPSFMLSFAPTGYKRVSHENYKKPDVWYYIGLSIVTIVAAFIGYIFIK